MRDLPHCRESLFRNRQIVDMRQRSLYKIEGIMSHPIAFDDFTCRKKFSTVRGDTSTDQEHSETDEGQKAGLQKDFGAIVRREKTKMYSLFIFSVASWTDSNLLMRELYEFSQETDYLTSFQNWEAFVCVFVAHFRFACNIKF